MQVETESGTILRRNRRQLHAMPNTTDDVATPVEPQVAVQPAVRPVANTDSTVYVTADGRRVKPVDRLNL